MKINKTHFSFYKIVVLVFALVFAFGSVHAADYSAVYDQSEKIPLTGRAITGTLPNGLTYYILENQRPENRAHLALVVNAGSVLERDDERGFAHFIEHLAFNDTKRFPKLELIEYLRSLGMRFGADVNAYTSYNETVYHFDVPVEVSGGIKKIPDRALAILDDWTHAVSFKPEDVQSESLVILEELRSRLGAMERARKIIFPVLFAGSAYADREPIGLAETIANATALQLKSFYDFWYTSDNMALVFVGDFDGKALEAELANHFNMPAAVKPVDRPRYELPPPENGNFHVEIITDPELTSSSFMIYYKMPHSGQRGTVGYYRQSVIDYLTAIMLNMRFEEKASDPDAAAADYWGSTWRWSEKSRFYSMGTTPKTGGAAVNLTEEALRELLLEKESIRRFAFTESELERAKLVFVSYMERQLSEKDRRDSSSYVNGFTLHFLTGEDMADIEWEAEAVASMLPGIGMNEIAEAVKNYFADNDCTVFLLAPQAEAENLPSAERIKEIFMETENANLSPRQDIAVTGELLQEIPASGLIISEEVDKETGAVILELSNGARVILKETANRNNEIIMYAMARGGTANVPEENIISASLVSEMVNVSGIGPYSRTELINKLAGKQVSFSFWNSGFTRGFQGSSTTQDIRTLFEMIYLFFLMPKLDERAVAAMLDQYRTNLAHQEENPQRFFSRELTRIIYNNHPLYMPLEAKDMDAVSLEKAFAFLNQCINPADYTFVFTGNLNPELMRGYSADFIASVPNAASMNMWVDPEITRPQSIERTIYRGQDERSMVYLARFAPGASDFDEKKNQAAAVLSEYLDILLIDEIREKLGGVYSISSNVSVSVIPRGEYSLNVFFQCDPARTDELIATVNDLLTDTANMPLNIDTFNKSKEALFMSHENSMQRNLFIAQSYINSSVLYNTPLNRLNMRPEAIKAVTVEDVQELIWNILAAGPVQIVLYPGNRE
ncbi:MAG: insulinase family protein [Treponema sp.]|jgi:zinc protease|nr:insulinase family protein [Treponema sp.]